MKAYCWRFFTTVLLCGFSFSSLQAQPGKITRFFLFGAKSSPRYSRILMKEEAARRALQASQTAASREAMAPLAQAEKQLAPSANFATRHKRLLWDLQTRVGISKRQALLNVQKWGAQPSSLSKYPPLEEEIFHVRDFSGLSPAPADKVPAPPFYARDGYAFGGMGLTTDGKDLRRVFRQGFLIQDAPEKGVRKATRTFLADEPLPALRFALRHGRSPHTVPALFAVRAGVPSAARAKGGNVSGNQIIRAAVLLKRDGVLRWYRVIPQTDGFLLAPYGIRPLPPSLQKNFSKL